MRMAKQFDRRWLAAVAILLLGAGTSQSPTPTSDEIAGFRTEKVETGSYPDAALIAWQRELQAELASKSLASAAATLAGRYGLEANVMQRLAGAFIVTGQRRYGREGGWKAPMQAELHALIPHVRSTAFGLAAIASALDDIEECRAEDFAALVAASPDLAADAYRIASAAPCAGNFLRAINAADGRSIPAMLRLLNWGALPRSDSLSAYQWLVEPPQLQRISPEARSAVAAQWRRTYLGALLQAGFDARAIRFYDGLSEADRAGLFGAPPRGTVMIDGIAVVFDGTVDAGGIVTEVISEVADELEAAADAIEVDADAARTKRSGRTTTKPNPAAEAKARAAALLAEQTAVDEGSGVALELAAAFAVAKRETDARRLLAALPQIGVQRRVLRCAYDAGDGKAAGCGELRDPNAAGLLLDQWLNHPEEDPYWLAETLFASSVGDRGLSDDRLAVKLYPRAQYPTVWSDWEQALSNALDIDREETMGSVDARAIDPVFSRAISDFASRRESQRAEASALRAGADLALDKTQERVSVTPVTPGFAEAEIPVALRGRTPVSAPKGLGPLPEGFIPVRVERDGKRAVAITVSQTFDPTGEVSQGGYWVHLSEDGGKSWGVPLYTGLADRFPYVVIPASAMKLLAGDDLHLAVEVAEIDTASIFYPPVALRTRRRATNLYLTIPIARLRADRDGNGLSDLAERHLLLDRPATGLTTPFVVGSDAANCLPTRSPESDARIALLDKVYRSPGAAIIEPLDRQGLGFSGWRRAASANNEPIFLRADPADYRCLRAKRPIIIYGNADRADLEKMTPDFHMLELPAIQFNRAGDRGFVRWSGGWQGGTYRLRRVDGRWSFETISSWIS